MKPGDRIELRRAVGIFPKGTIGTLTEIPNWTENLIWVSVEVGHGSPPALIALEPAEWWGLPDYDIAADYFPSTKN